MIIHVSYTALYSEDFKTTIEEGIVEKFKEHASSKGLFRMFSLRYEFPDAFHRLLAATESPQTADIEIKSQHFPFFLSDYNLQMTLVSVYVKRLVDTRIDLTALSIKGEEFVEDPINPDEELIREGIVPSLTGDPLGTWSIVNELKTFIKDELEDIIIVMQYTIGFKKGS